MRARAFASLAALASALLVAGCDPGIHLAWQDDVDGPVDPSCIVQTLKQTAKLDSVGEYVSSGERGFKKGDHVTQFNYSAQVMSEDVFSSVGFSIDLAKLSNGKTRIYHRWGKLGTEVSKTERAVAVPLMRSVNRALAVRCKLFLGERDPEQGGG